jgi:hypothetical protein
MSSNPAMVRRSVVLPQPEGPSSEKNSPAPDGQVDAAQRVVIAIIFMDVLELDHRLAASSRS